jgi:hypothetical protein
MPRYSWNTVGVKYQSIKINMVPFTFVRWQCFVWIISFVTFIKALSHGKAPCFIKQNLLCTVLLHCIINLPGVVYFTVWDRTCSILCNKLYATFYLWPMGDWILKCVLSLLSVCYEVEQPWVLALLSTNIHIKIYL